MDHGNSKSWLTPQAVPALRFKKKVKYGFFQNFSRGKERAHASWDGD
jgi:hypothetical protein